MLRSGIGRSMRTFDAHCHLKDDRLMHGLDDILSRARTAGVEGMLCCGTMENDWQAVSDISHIHASAGVLPSFGLHPWHVTDRSQRWLGNLEKFLLAIPCAGVGEIGLDRAIENSSFDDQEAVFIEQLDLAIAMKRHVSIHCRRAWDALPRLLANRCPLPRGFVVHSFSGGPELVRPLADMGGYFSFSGSITRSGNKKGHKALAAVPPDRLLIETDSPDLLPVFPDKAENSLNSPNEPANLRCILRKAADLLGKSEAELAEQTWRNASHLLLGCSNQDSHRHA